MEEQEDDPRSRKHKTTVLWRVALFIGMQVLVAITVVSEVRRPGCHGNSSQGLGPTLLKAARAHHAYSDLLRIGCVDALIVDDESRALVFDAGGGSGAIVPGVICKVTDGSHAPACAEVAATYLRTTIVPTHFFIAGVMSNDSGAYVCQRRFSREGVDQGELRKR